MWNCQLGFSSCGVEREFNKPEAIVVRFYMEITEARFCLSVWAEARQAKGKLQIIRSALMNAVKRSWRRFFIIQLVSSTSAVWLVTHSEEICVCLQIQSGSNGTFLSDFIYEVCNVFWPVTAIFSRGNNLIFLITVFDFNCIIKICSRPSSPWVVLTPGCWHEVLSRF